MTRAQGALDRRVSKKKPAGAGFEERKLLSQTASIVCSLSAQSNILNVADCRVRQVVTGGFDVIIRRSSLPFYRPTSREPLRLLNLRDHHEFPLRRHHAADDS